MKEDVIDDADKSVKQQANNRGKKPLLKSGQRGKVHVGPGTVAHHQVSRVYIYVPWVRFRKAKAPISGICNYSKERLAAFVNQCLQSDDLMSARLGRRG